LEGYAQAQFAIHVIDVGQADAILLEFKSSPILIDAGAEATGDDLYRNHLLSDINAFFAKRGDLNRTLQAIIVTHPHIDHTRSLMDVFQNFTVKYFYDGGDMKGSGVPQLNQARRYASSHAIQYTAIRDEAIRRDGFTPTGLGKLPCGADVRFLAGSRGCANGNNNSLVLRVHYDHKTALLTGDSETDDDDECEEGQVEHLLERYQGTDLLRADIYKVGHHGSHNSTDEAFVSAVSPAIALISAGHKETREPGKFHAFFFGHPREDVVELLEGTTGNRNPPVRSGRPPNNPEYCAAVEPLRPNLILTANTNVRGPDKRVGKKTRATTRQHGSGLISRPVLYKSRIHEGLVAVAASDTGFESVQPSTCAIHVTIYVTMN
jgi:competence protein ComEC